MLKVALSQGLETDRMATREGMSGPGAARNALAGMRLTAEGAAFEGPAVALLARAADGSLHIDDPEGLDRLSDGR